MLHYDSEGLISPVIQKKREKKDHTIQAKGKYMEKVK